MSASPSSPPPSPASPAPPRRPRLRWWQGGLLSLASGALMALAYPPYDFGNYVWVGLLPLLTLLWLGPPRLGRAFGLGWLYGMGWYGVSFWWIHEVGTVFQIPLPLFLSVAFFPLMALYACLPGLWASLAGTLLRPALSPPPQTEGMNPEQKSLLWSKWATADLLSTLRSALGCGALWVCIEWLRGQGTLGFSWNSLGMALYGGLSFAQWAEFVGTAALSFLPVATSVILWCAMRRVCLHFRGAGKGCRPWDFYGAVIVLFALFTGGLALSRNYAPNVMMQRPEVLPLPVVALQINQDQAERIAGGGGPELYGLYLRETMAAYRSIQQETIQRAMQHPEVGIAQQLPVWVVWPESAMGAPIWRNVETGLLTPDALTCNLFFSAEKGLPRVRELVREMGGEDFILFTGVDEHRLERDPSSAALLPRGMYNSIACIPGGFDSIRTVSKQHLMPFGEYIPLADSIEWLNRSYSEITGTQVGDGIHPGEGTEPLSVPIPGTEESIGVIPAVCYEDTVGDLLRHFVRRGPQVIVNATNDAWFRDSACGVQQARAAAFRCIELRRPMVRAANKGLTCAIAPNGAPLHELRKADGSPHLAGYSYAVLPVDRQAGFTLYALCGDWAVAVCALIVLLLCLFSLRRQSRVKGNHPRDGRERNESASRNTPSMKAS